jgi:poly(hydroxyalkanoate) depolymerase family esterase
MNNDFVAEILRATGSLRSGDPAGASAIIQAALAQGGLAQGNIGPTASRQSERAETPEARVAFHKSLPSGASQLPFGSARMRKPLGEALQTLAHGRSKLGLDGAMPRPGIRSPTPELPLPEGAEFRNAHFSCSAGKRRYRLYIPASANDGLQGLIVMLHGCTQNPEDFAAGTGMNALAEKHRLLVVYPAQTNAENTMSCWNWFRPQDQRRDAGEPAILAGLTRSIRDEFEIPHDQIFVAGLSAGGAMAAILGETYPDLYSGIGVHSGLAYGSANDVVSAFSAMRGQATIAPQRNSTHGAAPRAIIFHGSADTTVHPVNADRILARHSSGNDQPSKSEHAASDGRRSYSKSVIESAKGATAVECWIIEGAQHAWSGGDAKGSYTDPQGPDASAAMVEFFLAGA